MFWHCKYNISSMNYISTFWNMAYTLEFLLLNKWRNVQMNLTLHLASLTLLPRTVGACVVMYVVMYWNKTWRVVCYFWAISWNCLSFLTEQQLISSPAACVGRNVTVFCWWLLLLKISQYTVIIFNHKTIQVLMCFLISLQFIFKGTVKMCLLFDMINSLRFGYGSYLNGTLSTFF